MVSTRGGPDPPLERLGVAASSVKPPTFACSLSKRGAGVGARVRRLGGYRDRRAGARYGPYGLLGAAAALLVGPVLWVVRVPAGGQHGGSSCRISTSRPPADRGTRIRLAWDGVGEVQHFVRTTTRRPIRVLRLLSIGRQLDVIFDDRLPGCEQLMSLGEMKVRHFNNGTRISWNGSYG